MFQVLDWSSATAEAKTRLLRRSSSDLQAIYPQIRPWIDRIRSEGDAALADYVRTFDDPGFTIDRLRVTPTEIAQAYEKIAPAVLTAIREQIALSRKFQQSMRDLRQMALQEMVPGVFAGKKITPLQSAGLYVPAGSAPLPTVMQILAVSAKLAGVGRIVACMPPRGRVPEMLVAADIAGVDELYCVGGVAAIAALAYGTESVRPVDKIAGPGSIYVQAAKALVQCDTAIDMIAGPSEVLIVADPNANPEFIAADLLAQAEHDANAASVLVTWSSELAAVVQKAAKRQIESLSRKDVILRALERYSAIVLVDNEDKAVEFANEYGPEHIELLVADPIAMLPRILNAGSIFLGAYAPVPAGDYATGTNNTLPTGVWTRSCSPISVRTFEKESEVQYLTKEGLQSLRCIIEPISDIEGLDAHKAAVTIRFPFLP